MKANMLSLHTSSTPGVWSKGHIFFFSKSGHVAYQIKLEEVSTYMQGNTLNLHTPLTSRFGLKGQILKLCRFKYINIFFIKLSTKIYIDNWDLCFVIYMFLSNTRVGISGTTAKSRQRKFVPSSHPGSFAVVATSRKGQTTVGTLACFDLL